VLENAHFSVQKNMALMGLGYQSVVQVKTDEFSRMDLTDLAAKIEQCNANGEQILAIVATAGTTDAVLSIRCVRLLSWRRSRTSGYTLMRPGAARC
jgi:hypothetical protein